MGKADLKKIPDKLTDSEKKKQKNDNVSFPSYPYAVYLATPHFPALTPQSCPFRSCA